MMFRVRFTSSSSGTAFRDFEADEQGIEDTDFIVLRRYLKGRGAVPVFRAKKSDIFSVELIDDFQAIRDMSNSVAMTRVWALASVVAGHELDKAKREFKGPLFDDDVAADVYEELLVPTGTAPNDQAKADAGQRLGHFPLVVR